MKWVVKYGLILMCHSAIGQQFDVDLLAGVSRYSGELQPELATLKNLRPATAITFKYGLSEKIFVRLGVGYAQLYGDDKNNTSVAYERDRNLNFKSNVFDLHLAFEYRLWKPDFFPVVPYGFVGVGIFKNNPFTIYQNKKVFLQPLGTEGQGLPEYPLRKPYNTSQIFIPIGGGLNWRLNDNVSLGVEGRLSYTRTDYIDDVSTTYANQTALLRGNGALAVQLAWRGDELNNRPYPVQNSRRGSPTSNDFYYSVGFTVGLSIINPQTGLFSLGGLFNRRSNGFSEGLPSSKRLRMRTYCPTRF